MSIKIEKQYNGGLKCLDYECPWQIPSSVFHLDICLTKDDNVMEIGSGGSTLFFANRSNHVVSVETDPSWVSVVEEKIIGKNIQNVSYHSICNTNDIVNFINNCNDNISVISMDAHHSYNRSLFLETALDHFSNITLIVLDNFADVGMFPLHHHLTLQNWFNILHTYNGQKWCGSDHEDMGWSGRGTRILTCKQPYLDKE